MSSGRFGGLVATVLLGAFLSLTASSSVKPIMPELPIPEAKNLIRKPRVEFVKTEGGIQAVYHFRDVGMDNNYVRIKYTEIRNQKKGRYFFGLDGSFHEFHNANIAEIKRNNGETVCIGSFGIGDRMPGRDYNMINFSHGTLSTMSEKNSSFMPPYFGSGPTDSMDYYGKMFMNIQDAVKHRLGSAL